jgi:hypothetical protein
MYSFLIKYLVRTCKGIQEYCELQPEKNIGQIEGVDLIHYWELHVKWTNSTNKSLGLIDASILFLGN